MKKKSYQTPTVQTVELRYEKPLLQSSLVGGINVEYEEEDW